MSRDIKVLHFIEDLGLGGAERLLATLLPLLPSRGIIPEVAVLGRRDEFAADLRAEGIPAHFLGLNTYRAPIKAIYRLISLMKREKYTLVHTHLAFANLYGRMAASWSGIPVTTSFHGIDYEPEILIDNPMLKPWKQKMFQVADRVTVRACTKVVAVSHFVAQSIGRRLAISKNDIDVIHNGIPSSAIMEVSKEERRRCRRTLNLPHSARVVVQVGRLTPQKGQLHTLRAAAALRNEPNLFWVLVGDGPLRARLEAECKELNIDSIVRFEGNQKDISAYLRAADVFVFPSLHEGLGIAAIEAMAAGLPIVAYRGGPLPEVIVDGQTGILVQFGDSMQLADAVRLLINHRELAGSFGEEGRRRVRDHFLMVTTADRHATFYRELLRKVRPHNGRDNAFA